MNEILTKKIIRFILFTYTHISMEHTQNKNKNIQKRLGHGCKSGHRCGVATYCTTFIVFKQVVL